MAILLSSNIEPHTRMAPNGEAIYGYTVFVPLFSLGMLDGNVANDDQSSNILLQGYAQIVSGVQ
jgi:hypothetical protein